VLSDDGGCVLTIPKGALSEAVSITVILLPDEVGEGGVNRDDAVAVAGVRLEPTGLRLERAASLWFPLRTYVEPGSTVRLQARGDDDAQNVDWSGIVVPQGNAAVAEVVEFTDVNAIKLIGPAPLSFAPAITAMEPTSIEEGATAAILITGRNFVPGGHTKVTVLAASGQTETRVEVRTIYVTGDGTKLGVTLKGQVMQDLQEGAQRDVRVRVSTPAGAAERTLSIIGHDEWDTGGAVVSFPFTHVVSRLTVPPGDLFRLAFYEIDVVERVEIRARTLAGTAGIWANFGFEDGQQGSDGTAGGAGGRRGSVIFPPFLPSPRFGDGGAGGAGGGNGFAAGGAGAAGNPVALSGPGAGGAGGRAGGVALAQPAAPSFGGDGTPGSPGTRAPFAASVAPPLEGGAGGGAGGGGGGGGFLFPQRGGGGGGGGAGGTPLSIMAGEEIVIDGDILAVGGGGGGGSFPASSLLWSGGRGAGGGGGAGGCIHLHGVRHISGFVLAVGGRSLGVPEQIARPPADVRTIYERLLANPANGQIRLDGRAIPALSVPAAFSGPDLDYVPDLVTPTPKATVVVRGASGNRLARVTHVSTGLQRTFPVPQAGLAGFELDVDVLDGFNDVHAEFFNAGPPPFSWVTSAPRRTRRFLHLPGVVFAFTFACSISPPTASVVTERSRDFVATVTGTTLTAVDWSVEGGAANGSVSPSGRYTAPSLAPSSLALPQAVTVRASSIIDPAKGCSASATVLPGIEVAATAAAGIAGLRRMASANVGQAITIEIPPQAFALTNLGFSSNQPVEFRTVERSTTGACIERGVTVMGTVTPGLTRLTVIVPLCATGDRIRVPGHGSALLQIVPQITSLDRDPPAAPHTGINGSGFVCGDTEVLFDEAPVPPNQVLSVTCSAILLAARPSPGQRVAVRTKGGRSNELVA
jgi:hypothetical protein